MIESPFFTIIVVALNAEDLIADTINSILKQSCGDYEIIVKDGLSNDRTLSRIPCNDKIRIISKKDISIYDAMNQAITYSKGHYINFLNCGDSFASSEVLDNIKEIIGNNVFGMLFGDYLRDGIVHKQPTTLTRFYMYRTPLCHQTVFFNGEYLRKTGAYNNRFRILADYDLELRLMKAMPFLHSNILVCSYLGGGVSESEKGVAIKENERTLIIHSHFSRMERIIFEIKRQITLPKLRGWMAYGNSPTLIKKMYQVIVNVINTRGRNK